MAARMRTAHWLRGATLGLSIFIATSAGAAPSAAEKETARTLVLQGDAAFAEGKHRDALRLYEAAHRTMGVPTTGLPLGKAQAALGLLVEARDTWLGVARYPVQPDEPAAFTSARTEASGLADAALRRIATLQLRVRFKGAAALDLPAHVTIDDAPVASGSLDVPHRLNPGKHVVVAWGEGFVTATERFELAEGETRALPIVLTRPSGKDNMPAEAPQSGATRTSPLVYVGFGVGGAGLVTGMVTGLLAMDSARGAKEHCDGDRCPGALRSEIEGQVDTAKTWGTISTIGFAVGIVGIGVGVYGVLHPTRETNKSAAKLEPMVGIGSLGLRGSF
jgi:hypothetical protein